MNIYFSGLGGVGIGPLALVAKDIGHDVRGSDIKQSRYTDLMKERGIDVTIGQTNQSISEAHREKPIDLFVYTSALPDDHPELEYIRYNEIDHCERSGFVNKILEEQNLQLIAIAGTHGKTTTTGMIIWMLQQAGIPISYTVGTNLSFAPPGKYDPTSKYFIYEADEYAKLFLDLEPAASIITSVEYDHPDTYPTPEEYFEAFEQFVGQSDKIFAWQGDLKRSGIEMSDSFWGLPERTNLYDLKVVGEHNRRNAKLALEMIGSVFGDDIATKSQNALEKFPGTERRFEKLSENLYTDYAHHPTEIASVMQMASELKKPVVVVYQPHQNARQHEIIESGGYGSCLNGAKKVYWLPTYLSRENPDQKTLSPEDIIATMSRNDHVTTIEQSEELMVRISMHLSEGDTVVLMTAGDADEWLRKLI